MESLSPFLSFLSRTEMTRLSSRDLWDAGRKQRGLLLFSALCEMRIFQATLYITPDDNNDNDSLGISKVS